MASAAHEPLVSIILPTYNRAAYLVESIDTCLAQTLADFEVVVVDDASTDDTPQTLANLAARDPRIRCLRHETNRKLPGALNTGFAAARGEFLTWTSDDDRFHPTFLEETVGFLRARPDVDYVYTDVEILDEQGRVVRHAVAMEPEQLITGFDGIGITSFLYRRSVYERVGDYAEDLFLAEDYDYWLRILAGGMRMHHLPKTLYQYRRHAGSLTDVHRGQTFLAAERSLLRHLPEMPWLTREQRGQAYLFLASLASWRGDTASMLRYTLTGLPYAPMHATAKLGAFSLRRLTSAMKHFLGRVAIEQTRV